MEHPEARQPTACKVRPHRWNCKRRNDFQRNCQSTSRSVSTTHRKQPADARRVRRNAPRFAVGPVTVTSDTPGLFPHNLFAIAEPQLNGRMWLVLETRPGDEKQLSQSLAEACIPHYLPLFSPPTTIEPAEGLIPLFEGYVFVFGNERECGKCREFEEVIDALPVFNQDRVHADLTRVYEILSTDIVRSTRPSPGNRVRIRAGILAGLEGTLIAQEEAGNALVSLDTSQTGAHVEIDIRQLEILE